MVFVIDPQNAGISGNMFIGALVDMGADSECVKNLMEAVALSFGGVEVSLDIVNKSGIEATFCDVSVIDEEHEHNHHINFNDFIAKIDSLKSEGIPNLTDEMVELAKSVFMRIAISEANVHGKSLEDIHFHEVGAADAVADVFGTIYGYFDLGMCDERVVGSSFAILFGIPMLVLIGMAPQSGVMLFVSFLCFVVYYLILLMIALKRSKNQNK